ncbi:MAG: hypothetical protein LBV68_02185 [Spirochaetaceae bacterium]|jgi:hypothetical protein|nr:hypothetical protein [Spirochaetaceae bacterium]
MKKGSLFAIFSIIFLGSLSISTYADSNTVEMSSRILDSFDGTAYVVDGEEYHYTWQAVASRYTTKTSDQSFPQIGVINTAPTVLERLAGDKDVKSLGIQGSFDRRAYNWIDIYPTASGGDGQPAEIPLLGRTRVIDIWAWGSDLNYYLEAYVRDTRGMIHVIPLRTPEANPAGSLRYRGWKNLTGTIPAGIPMVSNVVPRSNHASTFVKFRLWTDPSERTYIDVERDSSGKVTKIVPFYLYIAQLKVLSDIYDTIYDGDRLANPKLADQLWSSSGSGGGNTAAANNQAGNNQ